MIAGVSSRLYGTGHSYRPSGALPVFSSSSCTRSCHTESGSSSAATHAVLTTTASHSGASAFTKAACSEIAPPYVPHATTRTPLGARARARRASSSRSSGASSNISLERQGVKTPFDPERTCQSTSLSKAGQSMPPSDVNGVMSVT